MEQLIVEQPVDVAGSVVGWVVTLRLRKRQPRYSIRGWLVQDEERQAAIDLLKRYGGDSLGVRREETLLSGKSVDARATALAHELLNQRFRGSSHGTVSSPQIESSDASRALADVAAAFAKIEVPMFLVSGTFLGAVRSGRFLESDYDIDVGFFGDQVGIDDVYRELVRHTAFRRVQCQKPWVIKADHRNGVRVDVFAHLALREGFLVHGSDAHHWWNTAFELTPVEINGVEYLGPSDAHRYLTENYGNWDSPVGFWDWAIDTPNRRTPETTEGLFTLVGYAVSKDRKRAEAALVELKTVFGIDYTEYVPNGEDALGEALSRNPMELPSLGPSGDIRRGD